mgnify:CR=1 FL=1
MSHCSQCGRYIGPYAACPYCGARTSGRLSLRAVKTTAVGLATVGLFLLWLAATRSPLPQVEIGQIGATANLAYVQVRGQVTHGPTYGVDPPYLSFTVDDGSGQLRISAYRDVVTALRQGGRIPALGDYVTVAGTLRVQDGSASMTLNVPEHLEVARPAALERRINTITAAERLLRVRLRGQVWAVRQPRSTLTLITIRDASGQIDVVAGAAAEALGGALLPLQPGQSVMVAGTVDLYQDRPQIVLASVQDVVLLAETVPVAPEMPIGALNKSLTGQLVAVEGTATEVAPFPAGIRLFLDDGSGEVLVLLWQDMVDALNDPTALTVGMRLRVLGQVAVYGDSLELIPQRPVDVTALGMEAVEELIVPPVPIADLRAEQQEPVTVEGRVVDVTSFSAGFKLMLDDGTGQVTLLLWLPVYDALPDPAALGRGAQVRATGRVESYEGALQLVPSAATEVTVLQPAGGETPQRAIASLSATDIGAAVTIEGTVTRAETFSSGLRIWLDDGTGQVLVLLWQNIAQRVPGSERLVAGARARISGVVAEYHGALEVVPQWPGDVGVE